LAVLAGERAGLVNAEIAAASRSFLIVLSLVRNEVEGSLYPRTKAR
jgi:hypothetical protein